VSRTETKQPKKPSPVPLWYWFVLVGVALVGAILITYSTVRPVDTVGLTMEGDYFQGNPDAPVTIYEWANFGCGACAAHVQETLPLLRTRYIQTGKVKYIYRTIIWDTDEPNQRLAAESLYCAGDQGKFWELHDWMYNNVMRWGQDPDIIGALLSMAVPEVGLEEAPFRDCLETEKYRDHVINLSDDALARGFTSTPSYLINDTPRLGFMDMYDFRLAIEGERSVSPGLQLVLAMALPAVLGLFLINLAGAQVGPWTIRLRMIVGVLALLGLLVAVHLSLYELMISGNLSCPLGNGCGVVNRSEYVNMFGAPIGLIGVLGYSLILSITLARLTQRRLWGGLTGVILIGLSGIGFLFSLYLTLFEAFTIQAFCSWCLVSALLMTGIFGVSIAAFVTEQREE
jgi:protein-disulfide isomerase/uncharacterized membrane protein